MTAYHRPETLQDVLALFARDPGLTVLAGGTDVYPAKTGRAGWGAMHHAGILDISRLTDLRGICEQDDAWRIGALTTWSDLARTRLPSQFAGLQAAARDIGGIQIQNRGTIGGNMCTASPAADGVPPLLTLDASVEVSSQAGARHIPLDRFIDGYRHTALRPGEIVTALIVPRHPGRGCFVKLGARKYLVISIVMVAALIDVDRDGLIRDARIAVGSCSAVAQRLRVLETALVGRSAGSLRTMPLPDDALSVLAPIDDIRGTAAYRRDVAATLIRDLIAGAVSIPRERVA